MSLASDGAVEAPLALPLTTIEHCPLYGLELPFALALGCRLLGVGDAVMVEPTPSTRASSNAPLVGWDWMNAKLR